MTSAPTAADLHVVVSNCLQLEKQNSSRLRDVAQFAARVVGAASPAQAYAVEVSKPGNLGKQLEQSRRAREASLAIAILEDDGKYKAEDYASAAETLLTSDATAVRAVAIIEKVDGFWRLRLIAATRGATETQALRAFAPDARFVNAGDKAVSEPGRAPYERSAQTPLGERLLDDRLRRILLKLHAEMVAANELKDPQTLRGYYAAFRERFGPEALSVLEGEALLETMHNHSNRQSLVYWLEFKDDDESPAIFGSIAGGSAHKFGVYKRKESGAWAVLGDSHAPKEVPLDVAIAIATKHRDQLLRAAQLLEALPENAGEAEYATLQRQLVAEAPDVADTAWGHKWLHMIFPEKLDDFHVARYQRYHLLRLLQPKPTTDGRYASAWRYVAIARELGIVLNHLTSLLNRRDGRPRAYWRVGTSDGNAPRNRWELMRGGNVVAVGWPKVGNIGPLRETGSAREEVRRLLAEHYPGTSSVISRKAGELTAFLSKIADGDVVCAADGAAVLGVGVVRGAYAFASGMNFPHQRPVDWLTLREWQLDTAEGNRTTVWQYKQYESLLQIERVLLDAASEPVSREPSANTGNSAKARTGVLPLAGIPRRIEEILERKGQVILYGPPGTGKTFHALMTAREMVARRVFGRTFDDLTPAEQRTIEGDASGVSGLVRATTFHPEYGYEGFIEGYHPVIGKDDRLAYERRDGVFKRLCDDARNDPQERPHVLVIDEINRGDIPRIFGELLTLVERDKRGRAVQLPLSGASFAVPKNVFVIGTMNTADRSIALLDVALRRRFGFVALMPDYSVLGNTVVAGLPLGPWLKWVNTRVRQIVGIDGRHREIGHGYLWSNGAPVKDPGTLVAILRDDIVPLLEEYCFEDLSRLEKILGDVVVDVDAQRVRYETFDGDSEAAISAILSAVPELAADASQLGDTDEEGFSIDEENGEDDDLDG